MESIRVPAELLQEHHHAKKKNDDAKQRFQDMASAIHINNDDLIVDKDHQSILDQRIELLRLQEQHARLTLLRDDFESWKKTARGGFTVNAGTALVGLIPCGAAGDEDVLAQECSRILQSLELALVQAHLESKHEKTLLERAQERSLLRGSASVDRQAYALSKVHEELTGWIEASLDKCHDDEGANRHGAAENEHDETDWDAKIDQQYEIYLVSRKKLLATVHNFSAPLPETATRTTCIEAEKDQLLDSSPPPVDVLSSVERAVLPALQHQHASKSQTDIGTDDMNTAGKTTLNTIERLSDESQLLLAFPILAHSGRFARAASAFGALAAPTPSNGHETVSKAVEPWTFAAKAADVAATATAEQQLQAAKMSMDAVSKHLLELELLKDAAS